MSDLAPLLQGFFTDHLIAQRNASAHTVASYRDTFTLLFGFVTKQSGRAPHQLDVTDLDAETIGAFLTYLETVRGNSVSTRNMRLAAIRSFFGYASYRAPEHAAAIARVLAIPIKRTDRAVVAYLSAIEAQSLVDAPDTSTWFERRDHALLNVAIHTGLRVSELANLTISDVVLGTGARLHCYGKGRKDRATPLAKPAAAVLKSWLTECGGQDSEPVFPTRKGTPLSRDAIAKLVTKYVTKAGQSCPSLTEKNVTPHTLRHTTAMLLLHGGVDITVIALWLGHESTEATQIYLHADMSLKEKALARLTPIHSDQPGRYQASDALLDFLAKL